MMNSDMISQTKEVLRRCNLEKMSACYNEYSNDWDARCECHDYEKKIRTLQAKVRDMNWTREVYALKGIKLSVAAEKYFSLADVLEELVTEADDIVAKDRAAYIKKCRERACEADNSIRSFMARELSLQWCSDLVKLYGEINALPNDVKQYSSYFLNLEKAYKNRNVSERAARFDDSVTRLNGIGDIKDRFKAATRLSSDYNVFSSDVRSLCKKREALDCIIKNCNDVLERIKSENQAKAREMDNEFDSYAGILSDERIAEARTFIKKYNATSSEAVAFCLRATTLAMKKFEERLDRNQKENRLRIKATDIDNRFSELASVKRDRTYFSNAETVISLIRSTSSDVLRFCNVASPQAASKLESAIKVEKKFLDYEEKINELSRSKTHTKVWCEKVWSLYAVISNDIDKCRNSLLLKELNREASRIDIEIACEPYIEALNAYSDFKKVLELDSGLKAFPEKEKLYKGIDSFAARWKQRVELAYTQARKKADEICEQARSYYNKKQYSLSFPMFVEADKYGNPDAAYYIGCHYWLGRCVKEDIDTAKLYFEKAAGNGDKYAMSDLADIYGDANMHIMEKYWRKRAVDAGYTYDALALAKMYYEGIGTDQSYVEALKYFEKATENTVHSAEANAYLGAIYENSLGVPQNEQLALEYYEKAEGIPWAKEAYDKLSHKLDEEKRDQEIINNLKRAKEGDPWAQYFIGWCYYNGYRTEKSYFMALDWLKKAAAGGVGKAMVILGDMYSKGEGVAVDKGMAMKYYNDAIRCGER